MTAKIKTRSRLGRSRHQHKPKGVSTHAFEKVYWPYIPVLIVVGILLTFSGQSGALQAAVRHHGGKVLAYSTSMSVSGLLTDTNNARSSNGVTSLNLNDQLDAAAQANANDMAARNYWSHNTPEGNPPWVWVTDQGYAYQKLGQNLAAGFNDEQSTINGWMASPPHRENLLDPSFSDVGFGFANNPNYTSASGGPMTIIVAFYGAPAATTPAPAATPTVGNATPAAPTNSAPPTNTPAPTASTPAALVQSAPAASSKKATTPAPTTTQTPTSGVTLGLQTSRAQVAFAKLPFSSFATGLATFGIVAAIGLWVSRHLLNLRRALVHGEAFVISHPLMDVGLLTIAALSYLLSQTAGLIQ
jgi:hypothetical protein